jgi:signal transduction histidine kinase
MHRPIPARRFSGRSLAATLIVVVIVALMGLMWWLPTTASTPEHPGGPWVWLPMLSFGVACGLAGLLWGRLERSSQLRQATQGMQAMVELSDTWVWRTNANHEVTHWRPPHNAPASAWTDEHFLGRPLYEEFEVAEPLITPGALHARLDAQAHIPDLRIARRSTATLASTATAGLQAHWRLRASPMFDTKGEFSGYLGLAAPVDESEQRLFDQVVLQRLWNELDLPVLVLKPDLKPEGGDWTVSALSADAARLLGPRAQDREWQQVKHALPRELATSLQSLTPGASQVAGQWRLDLLPLDAQGRSLGRMLVLRPAQDPAAEQAMSAADQDSFVYSVSHDLRAPLRVVDGFARILKEDYGRFLDRIGNDHLDRVLAAGARMNSMIDALLALSRLQSQPLVRKPVDLSQLATYIVEDLRSSDPERQASITIEPGLVVNGDATLLRVAMENLLGNAWKYSSHGEQTVIEFRCEPDKEHGRVFVIADQGAGFDMRFADRLFGVFQRLHSAKDFQGTGVGLASVRRIVRRHGGDIWAESEVGKGARFFFTIG